MIISSWVELLARFRSLALDLVSFENHPFGVIPANLIDRRRLHSADATTAATATVAASVTMRLM
jgi:hypothetical protein